MDKEKLERNIFEIAFPIAQENNCELVDVEFIKEEREWFLRVYIDKEDGINIDDCANVSRILSDKLDEIDPIEYSYYLEVSSPGPNRPLKTDSDFIKFEGKNIKIKFSKPFEGKKYLEGTLKGTEGENVLVESNGAIYKIDKNITSFIKLNDI